MNAKEKKIAAQIAGMLNAESEKKYMETITITDLKELYERLADAELFFDIENDGKTITIESPVNKYYDPLKKIGYGYYGNFAKYVYHLNENEYLRILFTAPFFIIKSVITIKLN